MDKPIIKKGKIIDKENGFYMNFDEFVRLATIEERGDENVGKIQPDSRDIRRK